MKLPMRNRPCGAALSVGVCGLAVLSLLVAGAACNSRPAPRSFALADEPVALRATAVPTSAPTSAPASLAAVEMKRTLTYLASDELEGRGLDTTGINVAAAYVAGSFQGAGLRPLPGMDDFFQRFPMTTVEGVAGETTLTIAGKALKLTEDYNPLSFSGEGSFDAPAVFVGYGITSKEHHYDDYANVDVKGKVAIAWRFEPADKDGKSRFTKGDWSDAAHFNTKARNATDHGAVALILVNPPELKEKDLLVPFAHQYQEGSARIPVIHVKHNIMDAVLKTGTGEEASALQAKADNDLISPAKVLNDVTISGKVALKRTTRELKNVVGYLPGEGPRADEFVIVGAHYDHLGRGGPGSLALKGHAHDIHHGADDNGSGTTAVVELAREYGEAYERGRRWPRSIVFCTFTAEEEGLIGSARFVSHPPLALDKVVAMLNLDMVGRLRDETLYVGGAGTAPSLETLLNKADEGLPLKLKDSGKGGLGPSDHMSFALKKIPVLFFFTGLHKDYHTPTDTVDKVNFNGMAEVVELSRHVLDAMTQMPKEQYVSSADAHSMAMGFGTGGGGEGGGRRATLGVIPTYGEDEGAVKGVKISGTSEGSPAAAAGLKADDVITAFGDKRLDNLMDLSTALASSKPGDKVKLKVLRDGKEIQLEATLAERK